MPKSAKYLLVGSTEAYSGKSAAVLGVANQCQEKGLDIAYGKPIGTCLSNTPLAETDEDVRFMSQTLSLPDTRLRPTLLCLTPETTQKRLRKEDQQDYRQALASYLQIQGGDLVILEGPGTLDEGSLFGLPLLTVAQVVDASILLVARFCSVRSVDMLLAAKQRLGDRLLGTLLNDIPVEQLENVNTTVRPFLEQQGIPVFGMLPSSKLLRSVTVGELVRQLKATVICCDERLELLVEELTIGAMNVSSALEYFRKGSNMAVVTGCDRTDIQLAALETSTHCLILTGHLREPNPMVLSRAEDLEIPILSVDRDTLTTVEIIERTLGQVRLHEPEKVRYIQAMMAQSFDIERLMTQLGLEAAVPLH